MIDDDGSFVAVLLTLMTANIKTFRALSERSLTQYSLQLSVFSCVEVQALHRCKRGRMTFLRLPFSRREISRPLPPFCFSLSAPSSDLRSIYNDIMHITVVCVV